MAEPPGFGAFSNAYRAFRPTYPPGLFDRILAEVPVERRHRAVDLGAGTGLSTELLLPHFREVVAVEPDAAMAAALRERLPGVRVSAMKAESHVEAPGAVDLATCGMAFYWLDGPEALRRIEEWLRPGGALAVYRYDFPRVPLAESILREEMEIRWDRHRHDRLRDTGYSRRTVEASFGFESVEAVTIPYWITLSLPQLMGFLRSMSFVNAFMATIEDPGRYLRTLEERLASGAGCEPLAVDLSIELVLARRR